MNVCEVFRYPRRNGLKQGLVLILLIAGGWYIGSSIYIYSKACLAQYLLMNAWGETLKTGKNVKPWPWADTWPIARLAVPEYEVDLIVLAGDSGRTLAFGPGHRFGTAQPGAIGNSVISGHRDTHFAFLKKLKKGDVMRLQASDALYRYFTISELAVVDENAAWLSSPEDESLLTLVTCYPFDAIAPGGPLRYVVFAEEDPRLTVVL